MMMKGEEEFRLRPRKPRSTGRQDEKAWALLFKAVVHYAARAVSARTDLTHSLGNARPVHTLNVVRFARLTREIR
jgi:hypothetical protein